MGLDNFATEGTTSTNSTSKSSSSKSSTKTDGYYKTFRNESGGKKVINSEEEWNEIIEFIEKNYGMTEEQLLNETQRTIYDIIHKAMLGNTDAQPNDFYPKRECIVCDKVFSFPTSWDFTKYEGEAVCKSHTIAEVQEAYEEMNSLHG